jgi:hypothetical protein
MALGHAFVFTAEPVAWTALSPADLLRGADWLTVAALTGVCQVEISRGKGNGKHGAGLDYKYTDCIARVVRNREIQ